MRKVILHKIFKRVGWGLGFIFLSYIIEFLPLKEMFLNVKFGYPPVDFMYVLFVSFIPVLVGGIGYGILISVVFLLVKYFFLPIHRVEKHYMGIRGGSFKKYLFIVAVMAVLIFVVPYFLRGLYPPDILYRISTASRSRPVHHSTCWADTLAPF